MSPASEIMLGNADAQLKMQNVGHIDGLRLKNPIREAGDMTDELVRISRTDAVSLMHLVNRDCKTWPPHQMVNFAAGGNCHAS